MCGGSIISVRSEGVGTFFRRHWRGLHLSLYCRCPLGKHSHITKTVKRSSGTGGWGRTMTRGVVDRSTVVNYIASMTQANSLNSPDCFAAPDVGAVSRFRGPVWGVLRCQWCT